MPFEVLEDATHFKNIPNLVSNSCNSMCVLGTHLLAVSCYRPHSEGCWTIMLLHLSVRSQRGIPQFHWSMVSDPWSFLRKAGIPPSPVTGPVQSPVKGRYHPSPVTVLPRIGVLPSQDRRTFSSILKILKAWHNINF